MIFNTLDKMGQWAIVMLSAAGLGLHNRKKRDGLNAKSDWAMDIGGPD